MVWKKEISKFFLKYGTNHAFVSSVGRKGKMIAISTYIVRTNDGIDDFLLSSVL